MSGEQESTPQAGAEAATRDRDAAEAHDHRFVQSTELGEARWRQLRGKMKRIVADLSIALGDESGAFPCEDESCFDDGSCDLDFEESAIEYLGDIQSRALELATVAERFRVNLVIREKSPGGTESGPPGPSSPDCGSGAQIKSE